uniref:Speckle-type POZ protein n=1 Tax=Aegilops tauschii TaxID=37682 RepID=N1R328_AEGTA
MPTSSHDAGDGVPSISASSVVANAVCGHHFLKIVGYSRTKEVPNGERIDSSPFQLGGRTWRVRYYPNGKNSEHIDYISLFLRLDDTVAEAEAVNAQAKFSLLDQHGNPVPPYIQRTLTNNYAVNISWGYGIREVHQKGGVGEIRASQGRFLHCQGRRRYAGVVPRAGDAIHRGDLLTSKAGVDVEFLVGGETFSAHRYVLAARSPVFRAEFFGSMKEGTTTEAIRIDDIEAHVFSALLTFMYSDALPDMKQQEEYDMAQHLLVAADRYGLERLKLICEYKLSNHIYRSTVAAILTLAERHHCHGLKKACLAFLGSSANLNAFMESEGFEFLTKSCPGLVKDLLLSKVVAC